MKRIVLFCLIVFPAVALLYFGLTRDPRTLPSHLLGRPAPEFRLEGLDGGATALAAVRGRPIVLNFWSTWCGTCVEEHRLMHRAAAQFASLGVQFFSVLYADTPENARGFLARYGPAAPILLDPGLRTAIDYGVAGVPETFFIDAAGLVRYKHSGLLTPRILTEQVTRIAKGAP
ncbi:MAG: redoxin domain-containing protein [Deltaproteobacteria bacterium]|nr:redoxin domain-containing protein [Deltaproteobacteria bacterium]